MVSITDFKEYVVDGAAIIFVLSGVYTAIFMPLMQMPSYYVGAFGAAVMYLFGKYTPNSA